MNAVQDPHRGGETPPASTATPGSVVVIGAGIVGACTALRLGEAGMEVVLVDREEPGTACSFGNAGRIATALARPKSVPGLLRKVPGMLRDHTHPLKTTPAFVARNLRWFTRFARAGSAREVERITTDMHALLGIADAAFDRLTGDLGAEDLVGSDGVLYIYRDPALAEASRAEMEATDRRGMPTQYVTGDQIRDIDAAIPESITCGYHKPAERFVRDPLALTGAVVKAFQRAGGTLVQDQVLALERRSGGAPTVRCRGQSFTADKVVMAAGAWSGPMAASFGIPVLVVAERGYHSMLPAAGTGLRTAVHYGDRLLSVTPMRDGLRVASGAEFADPDAAPDWSRQGVILDAARSLYPELDLSGATRWMGSRPSTPDTLPVIGASPREPDLLFATGHGTLGLTLAALTGELVRDVACGRQPAVDLSPYSPARFGG